MTSPRPADVANYCDQMFEAGQRALVAGDMDQFKRFAQYHQGFAELYHHLSAGGSIH